ALRVCGADTIRRRTRGPRRAPEQPRSSDMSHRRVVVTGMGIVSPIGNTLAAAWDSIKAGRSGIGPITHFDPSDSATRIAGAARDFDAKSFLPPKDVKKMDTFIHYGL